MNYNKFLKELKQNVLADKEIGLKEDECILCTSGYQPEDNAMKKIVRFANAQHCGVDDDTRLIADFLFLMIKLVNEKQTAVCHLPVLDLYRTFEDSGWDGVRKIICNYAKAAVDRDNLEIDVDIENYELMKPRMVFEAVNYDLEKAELKNYIYYKFEDIAYVVHFIVQETDSGVIYGRVPAELMEKWCVSREKIWDDVIANTYVKYQPRIYKSEEECTNASLTIGAFMTLGVNTVNYQPGEKLQLSTTSKTNGAVAIWYPEVQERIVSIVKGDYYVVFYGSWNNVLIMPVREYTAKAIREAIDMVESYAPNSVLSKKVFRYYSKTKELKVVE